MTKLTCFGWATLIVGLVGSAFILPWALPRIKQADENLRLQQELLNPPAPPAPSAEAVARAHEEAMAQIARQVQAAEEAAQLKAERCKKEAALAVAAAAAKQPAPPIPAHSIVPPGSPELVPLNGWIDQPDKSKPGRLRTNLRVTLSSSVEKPKPSRPAPCTKKVLKPAERVTLPSGWIDVPARTISVPCDAQEG